MVQREKVLDQLLVLEARRALAKATAGEVFDIANSALAAGFANEALIRFASERAQNWREIDDDWHGLLRELGLPRMTPIAAVHVLSLPRAQEIARHYCEGKIDVMHAVEKLDEIAREYGRPPYLAFSTVWEVHAHLATEKGGKSECGKIAQESDQHIRRLVSIALFDRSVPGTSDPALFAPRLSL